jgi:hypothetical protein
MMTLCVNTVLDIYSGVFSSTDSPKHAKCKYVQKHA